MGGGVDGVVVPSESPQDAPTPAIAAVPRTNAATTRIALTRTAIVVATHSPPSHGGGSAMKTLFPAFPFAFALICLGAGCGDDDEEPTNIEVATEGVEGIGDHPVDPEACERFCEKANECARAAGREVPEEAADCEASCGPGGVHRRAPAAIHACASEPCGPSFVDCSRRAMLEHMRSQEAPAFPPVCEGLCEKSAWCHRRTHQPLEPGEEDCEAACRPGGAYAEVSEGEILCVAHPCGVPFETCRAEGGPRDPEEAPRAPTSPSGSDSP